MFEDILDGFKELEDELEKSKQPDYGEPDPGNILSLDTEDWDTGKSDKWDTGETRDMDGNVISDDKVWKT